MQFDQSKRRDFIALLGGAAVLSFALCIAATAKDAKVGGVLLKLPPPPGYCELDPSERSDLRLLSMLEGVFRSSGNRLLVVSADCTQLDDWRAGNRKFLDNLAQYQTRIALENSDYSTNGAETIRTVCNETRREGEKMIAGIEPDVRARYEEVLKNVKLNETRFIGVLGEEPTICYAALVTRIAADGAEKTQIIVWATTIVGGKIVYLYLFAPDVGGNSIADVFVQVKAQTARFKAAN
jgi:hypothetical protein